MEKRKPRISRPAPPPTRHPNLTYLKAQLVMELLKGKGVTWRECLEAAAAGEAARLLRQKRGW